MNTKVKMIHMCIIFIHIDVNIIYIYIYIYPKYRKLLDEFSLKTGPE